MTITSGITVGVGVGVAADPGRGSSKDRRHGVTLQDLEWVRRRENLVVCGPSGTGKSFLLEALGQHAVEQGLKMAWFTLENLGVLLAGTAPMTPSAKQSPGRPKFTLAVGVFLLAVVASRSVRRFSSRPPTSRPAICSATS